MWRTNLDSAWSVIREQGGLRRFHRTALMCFALLLPVSGFATTRFVSTSGTAGASGSREDPFDTVYHAAAVSQPGDTVRLLSGTYTNGELILMQGGAPELPLVILGDAENPAEWPLFDRGVAPSTSGAGYAFWFQQSSWIRLERLRFENCWPNVIVLTNSSYIEVANCEFKGGQHAVFAEGLDSHHLLVEQCIWEQDERVWTEYDWEEMHHGTLAYFNGSLLKLDGTSGSFVIRHCTTLNVFNGFRTAFATAANRNACNGEVTENVFLNQDDNAIEPEGFAWNLHISRNHFHNIHKTYSFDSIGGGRLYVWGNVHTQTRDATAIEEVSGVWKFIGDDNRHLTYPCYAFNNSFWTEARAFKDEEATNREMKHFNNAYFFFDGSNRMNLTDWHDSFEFDYDAINQPWPANITNNAQEAHGIITADMFVDGEEVDFALNSSSPLRDGGKVMAFEELSWAQSYQGDAPDIGAYEGELPIDGPPFRYQVPPGGALCAERPRIVRGVVSGNQLVCVLSAPLAEASLAGVTASVMVDEVALTVSSLQLDASGLTLTITAESEIDSDLFSLHLDSMPIGVDGEPMTGWASAVPLNRPARPVSSVTPEVVALPDSPYLLTVHPNPSNGQMTIRAVNSDRTSVETFHRYGQQELVIFDILGREVARLKPYSVSGISLAYSFDSSQLSSGRYFAVLRIDQTALTTSLTVLQ